MLCGHDIFDERSRKRYLVQVIGYKPIKSVFAYRTGEAKLNRIYGNQKRRFLKMSDGVYGGGFALLVVLFILLIIIGASWGYGY